MKIKLYLPKSGSLCLFFILFSFTVSFSQQIAKSIPNATSPDGIIGFLEFKPADYGSQKHPLIIFLHGTGERGNGSTQLSKVTANAIPKFCAAGATMRFTVGGQTSSFVVLSPQLSLGYGSWPPYYVKEMIKYAKANLQIDTNRIYITGLSLGGGGTWRVITDTENFDHTFDAGIAAAAPVCGTQEENDADFASTIGANHLPIWAFHSMDDGKVGVGATQHAEILGNILGIKNPAMKFTYYQTGGHSGAWIKAYDTGHITTPVADINGAKSNFTANPNLYEWFLSNTRAKGYTPPVVSVGIAQTITLPLNTVTLTGNASGTNGATISSYTWTKTSGPAAGLIGQPLLNTTLVTGLVQGVYVFTLTVKDNHGLTSSSSVTITVNPLFNQPPVANAGNNIAISLPANSTTLNGSASADPDGSISTYSWTKTSGPTGYTIANPNAASTAITNLVQGVYIFTLQVTDNGGASSSSTVTVTVNAAPNQAPVANAGGNINITLPNNTATLDGSASADPDGTISAFAWSKISGPSTFTIANSAAATTALGNLVAGIYVFALQVKDNGGATASSTVTVTVNAAPNQLPIANAGNNATLTLPANSTTLDGTASADPDGSISTYTWTKTSGPLVGNISNAGSASTTVTNLVQGVYVFTLTVKDNGGATASANVIITVNAAPNQLPVANAGSNMTLVLPVNSTTLNGNASVDPDGSISTYAWTQTSGPSAFNIANAAASTTALTNLVQGVYVFTLQVTDNGGATASSTVTITVNAAANQLPIANAGSNITLTLPINSTTLNGSASSDPDGSISSYAWTKTSGPAAFVMPSPASASTPLNGLVQGVYVFTLQVTDNGGAIASSTVSITVNPAPNQAPNADAGSNISLTLPVNSTVLNGTASADPDGSISSYAWSKTSGPAAYSITNPGASTTALTNLAQGVYVFTLQVKDNAGATDSATVTVTVNAAPNQLPVANAGANITLTLPANSTTLNGTASSDPDGSISSYAWTYTSGPAGYNIANAGLASTALTNLVQGIYVFTLQVTDNNGGINTAVVTVTVNAAPLPANQSPIASAGSNITLTLPANSTTLNGSASSDPDGSISTYAWSKTSGPAVYSIASSGTASTALTNLVQGVYVFTLQVTDNGGATAAASVTITVKAAPNQLPVASAGSNITLTLPANSTTLNGSASSDPDGSISSYSWSKTSGPATFAIANASAVSTALTNLVQGIYVFTLQVKDNAGATDSATVTVTVKAAPNQRPVADAGSNISITLPIKNALLDGSASKDPDGSIIGYTWSKTSGPIAYTFANAGSASTMVNNLTQGVYVFMLQVKDNSGAVDSSTVTVTVHAPVNQAPVADAGSNITITLPVTTAVLNGSASVDPDGTITNYTWSKTSGPAAYSIANANTATTAIGNLAEGVYVFTLQVKDNGGAVASSTVSVTVKAAIPIPVNQPPVANAGANVVIVLPVNSAVLNGSLSSDPDGTINSYAWTKISGPASYSIANAGAATTQLSNLTEGVYIFTLKVTDNAGATDVATVAITVYPVPNQAPVADAGKDINIVLPVNTAYLDGRHSSDPDGTIVSYSWSRLSGPGAITIVNSNSATPSVVGLTEGQYIFELTVTDNSGATATDQVIVAVNPAPNSAPVANAGKDTTIAMPVDTISLSGSASADADGSIAAYHWRQLSGPIAAIAQPDVMITTVRGLVEGDYVFELEVTDNYGASSTADIKVSVVNNFRYSQFYKLYPNPAHNNINIQFIDDKTGKMGVIAYDVNGRRVMNEEFSKDQSLITKQLDISRLKAGMYYLELRQADGSKLIRPFVKQ